MAQADIMAFVDADINQFDKKMKTIDKQGTEAANRFKKNWDQAGGHVSKVMGKADFGGALNNTFSNLKDSALNAAPAVGALGGSLGMLGAAGVAAGVALGGAAISIQQAMSAMAYADDIGDTANKLGITTDALQELDFMAIKAGGSQEEFRAAIEKANVALGTYRNGIKDAKVQEFFEALGITPEKAREFNNIYEMLPLLADKVSALGNAAEQAQFAQKLGMDGLLPALKMSGDEIRAIQQEAHALGLVIDEDMISKAGEMQDELEIASKVVDVNLKRAFIDLAPFIVACVQKVAELARWAADAAESLRAGGDFSQFSKGHIERRAASVKQQMQYWRGVQQREPGNAVAKGNLERLNKDYLNLGRAYLPYMQPKTAPTAPDPRTQGLAHRADKPKGGGGGKGNKDAEAERAKREAERLAEASAQAEQSAARAADKAELDARLRLVKTINDQYAVRLEMLNREYDLQNQDLDRDAAEGKITEAAADHAKAANDRARRAEIGVLNAEKAEHLDEERLRKYEEEANLVNRVLSAKLAMANTAEERRRIEDQMFADQQAVERRLYEAKLKQAGYEEAEVKRLMQRFDEAQSAEKAANDARPKGPLDEWRRSISDINTELENIAVQGLDAFTDGLTDAIMRTENLGEVFKNVANQIIRDLIRIGVQRMITEPLANMLFGGGGGAGGAGGGIGGIFKAIGAIFGGGRAVGGPVSPGRFYRINENGQEYFQPTVAGKIIPAGGLGVPGGSALGGAAVFNFHTTVHADDAVMAGQIRQEIAQSNMQAVQAARQLVKIDMGRSQQNQLYRR